jgi:hypothetical protein
MNLGPFIDWRKVGHYAPVVILTTIAIIGCVLVAFLSPMSDAPDRRERIDSLSGGPYVVQRPDGLYLGWVADIADAERFGSFEQATAVGSGGRALSVREAVR